MRFKFVGLLIIIFFKGFSQEKTENIYPGFKTEILVDSSRIYKPNTTAKDSLHFRPVDLDIWYPSHETKGKKLLFGELFQLYEKRSNAYQEEENYTGLMQELAQYFAVQLGLEAKDGDNMLKIQTESYENSLLAEGKFPVIFYTAGYNGMGFENYILLEELARNGFVVVSIWSVGRFPGNMSNDKLDTMQQVYDAEFALKYLKESKEFSIDFDQIGILGCSWGGMSAAIFADRNPTIKAMASLDGTEIFYYGDTEEDDAFLNEIYEADFLHPEKMNFSYYYMESGNKWDEFSPTAEYNYFKKLPSEKRYLRFLQSAHEDFGSFPSLLKASNKAIKIHQEIIESTTLFFKKHLKYMDGFDNYFDQLAIQKSITTKPFEIDLEIPSSFTLSGKISDFHSSSPLPYVNIGVLGKKKGTVSSENGSFELELDDSNKKDTIRISRIGYYPKILLVENLFRQKNNLVISLQEEVSQLDEIVIGTKGLKNKTIGNKTETKFINAGFSYDQLGAEMGIKMNIRKDPAFVDAFHCSVSQNRLSSKSIFRLNIYEVSKGRPGANLLKNNILIPIESKQTGVITVDLRKYNIVLKDDVIVTMEWVENTGETNKGEAIFFSLGVLTGGTLHKESSQGKLKKLNGMGVGFTMDVRY